MLTFKLRVFFSRTNMDRSPNEKRKQELVEHKRLSCKSTESDRTTHDSPKNFHQAVRKLNSTTDFDFPELDSNTRIAAIALMIEPLENELQQLRMELRRKNYEIDFLHTELERERLEREEICQRNSRPCLKASGEAENSTALPILLDQALLSSRLAAQEDLEWINHNHSLKLEKMENDTKRLRTEAADKDFKIASLTSQLSQALDMLDKSLRQQTAKLLRPSVHGSVALSNSAGSRASPNLACCSPEPDTIVPSPCAPPSRAQPPHGAGSPCDSATPYSSGPNHSGPHNFGPHHPGPYSGPYSSASYSSNGALGCLQCGLTRAPVADAQTQSPPSPAAAAAAVSGRLARDLGCLLRAACGLRREVVPRGRLCAAQAALVGCQRAARRTRVLDAKAAGATAAAAAAVREEAAAAVRELAGCRREVRFFALNA